MTLPLLTHTQMIKDMTMTLTIKRTKGDTVRWWVGTRIMKTGAWILGVGRIEVKDAGASRCP